MIQPVSKPMPLSTGGNSTRRIGTVYRDATLVFLHDRALDEILDYSHCDLRCETGGFLVGGYYEDSQPYIEIANYVPATDAHSHAASLTFTHETWAQANADVREQFPGQRIVGWHHTHPGLGLFFSEYDLFIHRNFFSQHWQVAMVVDPRQREFVFYQWRGDALVDCGFICVADTEAS